MSWMMAVAEPCGCRRGMAADDFLARQKPAEPHYYLFAIGARSGHQGKGIGGKLMSAGLEQAR